MLLSNGMSYMTFDELVNHQSRYCIPLFVVPSMSAGPQDILHSATGTLVETPEKQLFVTSHHVWARFLELQQTEGALLA